MSRTLVMRALVAVAPLICSVVAAQECDPCASVVRLDLETLSYFGKYLCCDLTCDSEYSAGCSISVLPENCRACNDWDDYYVAYDEPDEPTLTPAPTERAPIVFLTSPPTERVDTFPSTSAPTEGIDTFSPTSAPTGTRTSRTQSCSTEEEARCADISPAQQEALDSYDNGGKVIVCDPTCVDGVSDPLHCNYYGLGQLCRGCGACSSCTPCP